MYIIYIYIYLYTVLSVYIICMCVYLFVNHKKLGGHKCGLFFHSCDCWEFGA